MFDFIGAGAVDTLVLTADAIIGKDFRTARNVGVVGGPVGVKFDRTGIFGYSGGAQKTFELLSANGQVSVYGVGMFNVRKADGTLLGSLDGTVVGGRDTIEIISTNKDIYLSSAGHILNIRADGDIDMLGTTILDLSDPDNQLVIPCMVADPGAPRNGSLWLRTDL